MHSEKLRDDEENIKMLFEEHVGRICQWPITWVDVEDAIREAYWAGVTHASGSVSEEE
jgi:DNA-binding transcriptional regulator WhiA